jgi:1-deoxy-D-xylulose-5-phosphate synthase
MAVACRLKQEEGKVIAVIGDGSLTAGLAYEGLNQAGGLDENLIVVFNDNGMSIAPNVGALSKFVSRALSGKAYQSFRMEMERILGSMSGIGKDLLDLARRSEESFKAFSTPGMLFEAFKFNYIGPVDGHRLDRLVDTFENVARLKGPVLVHVLTKKGKGYRPAEENPAHFHGVGALRPKLKPEPEPDTYTRVFGRTMEQMAEKDERVIAITAAMPEGTGLQLFAQRFPDRFIDVGIAEQHAVTFAAGLATQGYRPVVAIYSTFLQRAFDQVVHDVCLTGLPVVFSMDRGGIAGEDGATHQGLLDLSFLRCVPNLGLMAPADEDELRHMLFTCLHHQGPTAVRYPRGKGLGVPHDSPFQNLEWGRAQLRREGQDVLLVGIGVGVFQAEEAARRLAQKGVSAAVVNARFVKPLDGEMICDLAAGCKKLVTVEENVAMGGFGAAVLEALSQKGLTGVKTKIIGVKDIFMEHGSQAKLRAKYEVDADAVEKAALALIS